jgi:hypothetical protein
MFLLNTIFFTSIALIPAICRGCRNALLFRKGCCYCGYDLSGNADGHCPECGRDIALRKLRLVGAKFRIPVSHPANIRHLKS